MNFLHELNNNTLLICNYKEKEKILLELNKNNQIINLKIMSLKEFYNNYFFNYNEKTIYYLKNKYQINIELATIYLDNLKYIINSNINNFKVTYLQEIYKDLIKNDLLIFNNYFKEYLKQKEIIILNDYLDEFTLNILKNYNYKIIEQEDNKRITNDIYKFETMEEEVEFTFNKISELLKNNVDIKNIKLVVLENDYLKVINRFSKLYNILVVNKEKNFYSTIASKYFKELINLHKTKEEINRELKNKFDMDTYNLFFNIINKYYFVDNLFDVKDLIDNDLKNINQKDNNIGIEIIDLNSYLVTDNDYVFVLGFNNENIPKTYKDTDYFNDDLKSKLGLLTSFKRNKKEKIKDIKNINSIKNIILTYKENSPYNTYYPSSLIKELNLNIIEIKLINQTSNLYNKIKLAANLDNLLKYNNQSNELSILYNTYPDINYLSYSNKFTKINNFNLDKLTLSYSSINNYYHCKFRYYIENILKLNIYEETFKQFIGTMFHNILSHVYENDFDLDEEWNKNILNRTFNSKEEFYLSELKEELKNIIKVIKYQYSLTGLTNLKLENEIEIKYNEKCKFVGIIDKIMFKEKDNNTYLVIIDYKTGNPTINLDNLQNGLDMQLPIYVYLTLNSNLFNNPQVIGFYLEPILHEKGKSIDDLDKMYVDNLKLEGYSINDNYLVSMFDETYENSQMIRGMKIGKNGFYHYTKVLSNDDILKISNIVKDKIKEAFNSILEGDFQVNPKIIKGENIGCNYCKYHDICYMTGKDYIYLKSE